MAFPLSSPLVSNDRVEISNLNSTKNSCENFIASFHLVHAVDVILPDAFNIPQVLDGIVEGDQYEYYLVNNVSPLKFINYDFVNAFIKNGSFYGLSLERRLDVDDCIAFYPSGKVILSLNKDTYQELGLQGRSSTFSTRKKNKFVVEIDVSAESFRPEKPNFIRVLNAFERKPDLKFDIIATWDPRDSSVSSRSVYEYLKSQGCQVTICTPENSSKCITSTLIPIVEWRCWETKNYFSFQEFLNWLGSVPLNIDTTGLCDKYITTYACPKPNMQVDKVFHRQWSGLITSNMVLKIFKALHSVMTIRNHKMPWISLVVHGFDDDPLTVDGDHGYCYASGDNLFSITLFPDSNYWLIKHLSKEAKRSKK